MTTELELIPPVMNAIEIFTKGGLGSILDGIEAKVRAIPLDGSAASGREQIRSLAYSVVRTKTALDAEGKALTENWRKATGKVNEDRRKLVDRLDTLSAEVRKPLTDYENKERLRVEHHQVALEDLIRLQMMLQSGVFENASVEVLEDNLRDAKTLSLNRDWEEFVDRVTRIRSELVAAFESRITARKKFEADQAELAALRAAEAERIQRERDERLQAEAAEKQRLESERKAAAEADAERQRVLAEQRAAALEHERLQAEKDAAIKRAQDEKVAAENKAKAEAEAERKRVEAAAEAVRIENERVRREQEAAIKKAEAAKLAAEDKAKADVAEAERKAGEAARKERERIEAERKVTEAADEKRAADQKNKARIRAEIIEDLPVEESAAEIADLLMAGKIRNVKVVY